MASTSRLRPARPWRFALALVGLAAAALAGCISKDQTAFYSGTNYEDKPAIEAVLNRFRDGLNGRSVDQVLGVFPPDFVFPDETDPAVVHDVATLRNGYQLFFERSDGIAYSYDDLFLRIDATYAQADVKVARAYRGHAPFNYQVNDAEYERIILKKSADGAWRFATLGHRLLPPTVWDK